MGEKLTVIDGKQYREVSRKANVGERIKIVSATQNHYPVGAVGICTRNDQFDDGSIDTTLSFPGSVKDGFINTCYATYVVLEPVESADELRALVDGLTETVANLTLRVTELERKGKPTDKINVGDIKVDVSAVARRLVEKLRESLKPKTRDEIVEQAKKDVAELTRRASEDCSHGHEFPAVAKCGRLTFKFVVNREKRTVVAIGSLRYVIGSVHARGKARCAPDDCFNAHIGRAIALRRALGLTVPTEYYEAPQPESVRVGDIVEYPKLAPSVRTVWGGAIGTRPNTGYTYLSSAQSYIKGGSGRIIDDSREEVSA